jgi:hypothetical protein
MRARQKREVSLEVSMRRRKGLRRLDTRNGSNHSSPMRPNAINLSEIQTPSSLGLDMMPTSPLPPGSTTPRAYTSSMADTLRNMRSSSMTAFNSLRMPRSTSRMSIGRWFGGSDSESDLEEDDIPTFMQEMDMDMDMDPTSNDTFDSEAPVSFDAPGDDDDEFPSHLPDVGVDPIDEQAFAASAARLD